jgi:hypothetical protein
VGLNYFKEPRSLFAARQGERCMKDTDHPMRHHRVHLSDRASARRRRGCARQKGQFGRGQDTVLGWSDPTFAHGSVAKVSRGSLQPNQSNQGLVRGAFCWRAQREIRGSRRRREEVLTALCLLSLSSPYDAGSCQKRSEKSDLTNRKVTLKKPPDREGATLLFRPSAAQMVRGVAPARHARRVTLFCPRAETVANSL